MAALQEASADSTDASSLVSSLVPQKGASSRVHRQQTQNDSRSAGRPRRWTRSQSPMRQLLNGTSGSRSLSPHRGLEIRRAEEDGVQDVNATPPDSGQTGVDPKAATSAATGKYVAAAPPVPPNGGSCVAQQRICTKDVFHCVSYDECHIPYEQDGDGVPVGTVAASVDSTVSSASNSGVVEVTDKQPESSSSTMTVANALESGGSVVKHPQSPPGITQRESCSLDGDGEEL